MIQKSIPGYPGYFADKSGQIWRQLKYRRKIVNPVMHDVGYQYTNIAVTKQLTQRLVCAAFKGESDFEVPICLRRAKRQQPRRVRSSRYLKWGERSDCGHKGRRRVLSDKQRQSVLELYANGITQVVIARKFGVSQPAISALIIRS